jgi:hypothetical protein
LVIYQESLLGIFGLLKNELTEEFKEKLEVTYLPNSVVITKKWMRREAYVKMNGENKLI